MTSTAKGTEVTFASAEAVQQIRDQRKTIDELKAACDAAIRRQHLITKNKEILELDGKNPDAEFRSATAELRDAERALSASKSKLVDLLFAERKNFDAVIGQLLPTLYDEVVAPTVSSINEAVGGIESVIDHLAEKLVLLSKAGLDSDAVSFDQKVAGWNELVVEVQGPSNARIDSSVRGWAAQHFVSALKSFKRIDDAIKRLRDAANTVQTKIAAAN